MKKTKYWKLENCYYGGSTKFDRNFIKNYEGDRISMHKHRDRRNWRGSYAWVPFKYTKGLLRKYINKPIESLERAYNAKVKDIKNAMPFRQAYSSIIFTFADRKYYRGAERFEYTLKNGIIIKNPEYKSRYYYKKCRLKSWQFIYNKKHIHNPGAIRNSYIKGYWYRHNTGMKTRNPIYLGKLYAILDGNIIFADVYHYYPEFLDSNCIDRDARLIEKKKNFESEWIKVNIGIDSLDYYKEEPNPKRLALEKFLAQEDISKEERNEADRALRWTPYIVKHNYGIGHFLYPVCKLKEIKKI